MLRGILIGVLAVGIAGTSYWGYKEHQEKNAVLIQAENTYQRSFHDLTYQMDVLHDKIGTVLAMNSRTSLSPALAEVWRITSQAHSNVGQLPLTLLPFNKTEEFLANVGDFSYRAAVRDLDKEPLSDREYNTLKKLYSSSADIQGELRNVQHLVLEKNLRWMDVELALASGKKQMDNTIVDGFKTVEKNVETFSDTEFGPAITANKEKDESFKGLEGPEVNSSQARAIAVNFLGIKGKPSQIKVVENGEGTENKFYSIAYRDPSTNSETYMDLTKKGGVPIWAMQNREVKKAKISLNDAANNAEKFLQKHKFTNQKLLESAQYDNVGVFTYIADIDGVRIYPDAIKMKIALDNGKVMAFSARDYLVSHKIRKLPEPKISLKQARSKINPKVKIMEERKAVIVNDLGEEVLCYEFMGTIDNDTYRIFINAMNGFEEQVDKMQNAEPIYKSV